MLVINADDLGRNPQATNAILECCSAKRITSASAMVFMQDSARAASVAKEAPLDIGLHINFTESFTGPGVSDSLRRNHERIRSFLWRSKFALLIYNPFLRDAFREVFEAQAAEFARLYGRAPARYDGHQHMHLCSNMVLQKLIPANSKVRRSFSFAAGEKNFFNRHYRAIIDRRLAARYRIGDFFFALQQFLPVSKMGKVVELARTREVELMTHPEVKSDYETLMSEAFVSAVSHNA